MKLFRFFLFLCFSACAQTPLVNTATTQIASGAITHLTNAVSAGGSQPTPDAAWYQFAGGGTADTSGSGNTLTLVGSPTVGAVSIGTASVRGITLNGTTQYATAADSSSLHFATSFSVSCWFKSAAALSTDQMMVTKYDAGGNVGFDHRLGNNTGADGGKAIAEMFDASSHDDQAKSSSSYANGNWHHFVGVKDSSGGNVIVYVDGASAGSVASTTGSLVTANGLFTIGAETISGSQDAFLAGSLADVEIYSRAVTPTEVTSLYGGGNGAR